MCRVGTFKPVVKPGQPSKPAGTDGPIPLVGVLFDVRIVDFCAEVTLRQRFENREDQPIEAIYEFVLDANATVASFVADIDGKRVEGRVKEKEKAKDAYDDAIAAGGGAFLLEQDKERPNVFSVNVGNLPPKKEALVSLTYVTEAGVDGDQLVFTLPGAPATAPLVLAPPTAMAATQSRYEREVPAGVVGIRAVLDMPCNIRSVTSRTHPISFEFGDTPTQATVTLAPGTAMEPGKDFVLACKLAQPHEPSARVQRAPDGSLAAMLTFYPSLPEDIFTEMLFVVDRSGSMAGSSMNRVKETLQLFLRSLPEGTLFNIIGFGTNHKKLFESGSVEYNDATLAKATEHVSSMQANMGGTNILNPLMAIFKEPAKPGIPRQIFLLTDGQVSNTQQCIAAVRQNANSTRVFTFGIGSEASVELVRGMAKAGEGQCELIQDTTAMKEKVMRQLSRALQPALTDIRVDWGGCKVQQTPYILPPLFNGSRMIIYGFVQPGSEAGDVTLSGKFGETTFTASAKLDPAKVSQGTQVVKLAARSLLRDLEEGRSYLSPCTPDRAKQETIRVSCLYGILSKETAFVAIEQRDEATEGTMQTRAVKIAPVAEAAPKPQQFQMLRPTGPGMMPMAPRKALARAGCYSAAPPPPPPPPPPPQQQQRQAPSLLADYGAALRSSRAVESEKKCERADLGDLVRVLNGALGCRRTVADDDSDDSSDGGWDDEAEEEEAQTGAMKRCKPATSYPLRAPPAPSAAAVPPPPPPPPPSQATAAPPAPPPSSPRAPQGPSNLAEIVGIQRANGSWPIAVLAKLGVSVDAATKALPAAAQGKADALDAWATFLVVAVLAAKYAHVKVEWDLLAKKALKWAQKVGKAAAPEVDWDAAAKQFLGQQGNQC